MSLILHEKYKKSWNMEDYNVCTMSSQCLPNVYPMPAKCPICLPNIPKFCPLSFPVKSRISSDMFWLKIGYMLKKDRLTAYWTGAYIWYIGEPFWTRAEESCLFTQSFWKTRPAPTRWNVNMLFTRVIKISQFEDNIGTIFHYNTVWDNCMIVLLFHCLMVQLFVW